MITPRIKLEGDSCIRTAYPSHTPLQQDPDYLILEFLANKETVETQALAKGHVIMAITSLSMSWQVSTSSAMHRCLV